MIKRGRKFPIKDLGVYIYYEGAGVWVLKYRSMTLEENPIGGKFYAVSIKEAFGRLRTILAERENPNLREITNKVLRK